MNSRTECLGRAVSCYFSQQEAAGSRSLSQIIIGFDDLGLGHYKKKVSSDFVAQLAVQTFANYLSSPHHSRHDHSSES